MKKPTPKERILSQLHERWRNNSECLDLLIAELEMIAVGMLLEMPGNTFHADSGLLGWKTIKLLSLQKDPRIYCYYGDAKEGLPFDNLSLEAKEEIVDFMWRKLNKE